MTRPIDLWPLAKRRGRPGYSAAHFARVCPGPDSPLLVADRLAARRMSHEERHAYWPQLCDSLELVISELELHANSAGIKPFLRAARAAKRKSTEVG